MIDSIRNAPISAMNAPVVGGKQSTEKTGSSSEFTLPPLTAASASLGSALLALIALAPSHGGSSRKRATWARS